MKPIKQTVYLPVKDGDSEISVSYWERDTHIADVKEESGYFFTPEELNEYTTNVIKQALENASDSAKIAQFKSRFLIIQENKQSILETFDETFKQFKV